MLPLPAAIFYPEPLGLRAVVVEAMCLLDCDLHKMVEFDGSMAENIGGHEASDGVTPCSQA